MTVKRQINFGQINLQKCKAAAAELNQTGYYDITLITEPYSTSGRVRLEVKKGAIIAANIKEKSVQPRACISSEGTRCKFSVSCPADHFCLFTNVSDLNSAGSFSAS